MRPLARRSLPLLAGLPFAALGAGQAEVAVSLGGDAAPWAGEQVVVNLDLKTDDLSFANVFFNLPAVEGGFLLRPDSTTVKLTERRGGASWQVLRYPVALFPQAGGTLTVPSFEVRFDTTAGFGSEPVSHVLTAPPLTVHVRRPPGVAEDAVVVTTRRHELSSDWTTPPEPVRAGNAFTLTVRRQAENLSAMLLPPLPVYETDGLAAYPAAPEVADRSNRGRLTAARTDRITWVVEQPGNYELPAIRFQWWDPETERLREQRIDGLAFSAAEAPGRETAPEGATRATQGGAALGLLAGLAGFGLLLVIGWRFRGPIRRLGRRILPPPRALLNSVNPGPRP